MTRDVLLLPDLPDDEIDRAFEEAEVEAPLLGLERPEERPDDEIAAHVEAMAA